MMSKVGRQIVYFTLVPVILMRFYSLVGLSSVCVTASQIRGNNGFEIKDSNFIWMHHLENNEPVSTDYIH